MYCVQFYILWLVQARGIDFVKQYIFRIFHSENDPTEINANNYFYTMYLVFILLTICAQFDCSHHSIFQLSLGSTLEFSHTEN